MTGRYNMSQRPLSALCFQLRVNMNIFRLAILLFCLSCVACQNTTSNVTTSSPDIMTSGLTIMTMEPTGTPTTAGGMTPERKTTMTESPTTPLLTTILTTTMVPTTNKQTTLLATTVSQSTQGIMSTVSTKSMMPTYMTTNSKNPSSLTTGYIALIAVFGALIFIVALAGLAYLCQRRNLGHSMKRRFSRGSRKESNLSIHRPESGMILDDGDTKLNTFSTDRKVETLGRDNPLFMKNERSNLAKGKMSQETGEVDNANDKATLPSRASLVIANETATYEEAAPVSDDVHTGNETDNDTNNPDVNDDNTVTQTEQDQQNGSAHVDHVGEEDKEPSESRPQSGVSYSSMDMDTALTEVGEELEI